MHFPLRLLLILILSVTLLAQQTPDIERSKKDIEQLYAQLVGFDSETIAIAKRSEIAKLEVTSSTKGEFETTKQFEQRKIIEEARIEKLGEEIDQEIEKSKCNLREKINQIISKEFILRPDSKGLILGKYDADLQRFPVILNGSRQGFIPVPLAEAKGFKDAFSQSTKIAKVGLTVDLDNRAKEYLTTISVNVNGQEYTVAIARELSKAKAMEIIFGNFDTAKQLSTWAFPSSDFIESRDTSALVSAPGTFTKVRDGNVEKLLFYAKEPDADSMGCHACGRILSYAIFTKNGSNWMPEAVVRNAGEYGSWSMLSDPKIVQIGQGKYAFVLSSGSAKMFYDSYFEIKTGCLSHMFSVELGGDNGDNLKVNVKFVPAAKEYFDATVSTSGKKYFEVGNRSVLKTVSKVETYQN